jgi:Uma2 family endonuclease
MSTSSATLSPVIADTLQRVQKVISWVEFQKKYLSREDDYKYEWLNGTIEKTPKNIDQSQIFIQHNLIELLIFLKKKEQLTNIGSFSSETDSFFNKIHRRPDIAYYSLEQLRKAAQKENQVPKFVIEIISPSDNINRVNQKVTNYFDAGVKVLWHIFPSQGIIHVYEDSRHIVICKEDDICSAATVIDGFEFSVNTILQLP